MSILAALDSALLKLSLGLLLVWWATWSLLDQYLLKFTPYSEFGLLFAGIAFILAGDSGFCCCSRGGNAPEVAEQLEDEESAPVGGNSKKKKTART